MTPARQAVSKRGAIASTLVAALIVMGMLFMTACSSAPRSTSSYTPLSENLRDTAKAQALNHEAAGCLRSDPRRAELLLRDAASADDYFGPAHNNLGVLYLGQGKLYEAAGEFEWAKRLMPGHPDPRMNLALTLERAGRTADALAGYTSALEVYPEHLPTMQALARLQVRSGRTDSRTDELLNEISLRGETRQWREWALAAQIKARLKAQP